MEINLHIHEHVSYIMSENSVTLFSSRKSSGLILKKEPPRQTGDTAVWRVAFSTNLRPHEGNMPWGSVQREWILPESGQLTTWPDDFSIRANYDRGNHVTAYPHALPIEFSIRTNETARKLSTLVGSSLSNPHSQTDIMRTSLRQQASQPYRDFAWTNFFEGVRSLNGSSFTKGGWQEWWKVEER